MGKIKDDAAAPKSSKAAGKSSARSEPGLVRQFLATLVSTELYKPLQGWNARLWTGVGLGGLLGVGVWQLFQNLKQTEGVSLPLRYAVPAGLAVGLGWVVYRLLQFPPFAEFLVATEAEMRKVSWISWADLKRATAVVLVTFTILTVYLFGVDLLWQYLLDLIGVMKIRSTGFGSTA
jgi:preprotein translocase subunit SecE